MSEPLPPLTTLLQAWRDGDGAAFAQVVETAFDELRRIAARRLRTLDDHLTFTPADLLNEAMLKVLEAPPDLRNRAHFFATLSLHMRSILVDRARARQAEKRGDGLARVTFIETQGPADESSALDLLAVDQALQQLAQVDPRAAEVLHLASFGGMAREEIAEVVGVSVPTVDRELRFARSWLQKALAGA